MQMESQTGIGRAHVRPGGPPELRYGAVTYHVFIIAVLTNRTDKAGV